MTIENEIDNYASFTNTINEQNLSHMSTHPTEAFWNLFRNFHYPTVIFTLIHNILDYLKISACISTIY